MSVRHFFHQQSITMNMWSTWGFHLQFFWHFLCRDQYPSQIIYHILYTCQLSRLRVENFDLTSAHACGPISHAWLKNVSCCRLVWHNFQKYVNSDPCKERKPCVKWINDNTFHADSDFWREKHCERAHIYMRAKTSEDCGSLRTSSEDFGLRWESSEMIVSSSKFPALPG